MNTNFLISAIASVAFFVTGHWIAGIVFFCLAGNFGNAAP